MALRNIVKIGDDVLRKVCRTQMTFDEKLATILDDMAEWAQQLSDQAEKMIEQEEFERRKTIYKYWCDYGELIHGAGHARKAV